MTGSTLFCIQTKSAATLSKIKITRDQEYFSLYTHKGNICLVLYSGQVIVSINSYLVRQKQQIGSEEIMAIYSCLRYMCK